MTIATALFSRRNRQRQPASESTPPTLAAHRDGVCVGTLKRAKFDLGVDSKKDGTKGVWYWSLPQTGDGYAI